MFYNWDKDSAISIGHVTEAANILREAMQGKDKAFYIQSGMSELTLQKLIGLGTKFQANNIKAIKEALAEAAAMIQKVNPMAEGADSKYSDEQERKLAPIFQLDRAVSDLEQNIDYLDLTTSTR